MPELLCIRMRWASAVIGGMAGLALATGTAVAGVPGFDREPVEIFDQNIFDLGTADHDDDGDLDLFTTNHLDRQSLLSNDGTGAFTERLYEAGLSQTRGVPGWEDHRPPPPAGPGLYVSSGGGGITLRHEGPGRVRGSVAFMFPVDAAATPRASALVDRRGSRFVARFKMKGDSRLRLDPQRLAAPILVRLKPPFRLERAYVGAEGRTPRRRSFVVYLRDRHGIAWADVSRDRRTDAFIVRGGLRGQIRDIRGRIHDELLLQGPPGEFSPRGAGPSLAKGACRGRAAGAVDFDGDGRLDLYSTCKGGSPKLFRRTASGSFRVASGPLRRAGLETDVMRFYDLRGDEAPEILAVVRGGFEVYARSGGDWRRVQSLAGRHGRQRGTALAAGDFDADGDLDVYAGSSSGSTLLVNRDGRLASRTGGSGLPRRGRAAAWTDYDNDGLLDLHTVPNGLFRQGPAGRFSRVGSFRTVDRPVEARLTWPDLDGDGAREAVVSARPRRSPKNFRTLVFTNGAALASHWLELDLQGRAGNPQAIGARVRVHAAGTTQTAWVGQNETSLYSQGHYRLYFGLGAATSANVRVRWTNGRTKDLGTVAADQLLTPAE